MPVSSRCPVCSHESRAAIEQAILNQKPKAQIALTFGFTYTRSKDQKVVGNHKVIDAHIAHMGDAFRKAMDDRDLATGEALVTRMRVLESEVDKVLERANKGEPVLVGDVPLLHDDGSPVMRYDNRLVLAAVRTSRANVEVMAKLAGRTEEDPEADEALRAHLKTPEGRRLLAKLEELHAEQAAAEAG